MPTAGARAHLARRTKIRRDREGSQNSGSVGRAGRLGLKVGWVLNVYTRARIPDRTEPRNRFAGGPGLSSRSCQKTVRNYVSGILAKLQVADPAENREIRRKPLPCAATGCRGNYMVRNAMKKGLPRSDTPRVLTRRREARCNAPA
jgi:hypothetical protein